MGKIELTNGSYQSSIFPGGEVHVRIDSLEPESHIIAELENSEDVMRLILLCDALKHSGAELCTLTIPYFPYARQDRVCNSGEALSVKVMADIINSLGASAVIIYDPHSDVTPALINNVRVIPQWELVPAEIMEGKIIICPDAGAEKKILKLKRPYIMATKIRDAKTAEITGTQVFAEDLTGKICIIVDDICDGGKTFIEIAKVLKEKWAKSVELYVTHGIFSKGFSVFEGLIDKVHYYKHGELQCWSSDKK